MSGILYGVGVGPGDPELMTLKAVRVIRSCGAVAVPDAGGEARLALEIAAAAGCIDPGKQELLDLPMPMTADRAEMARAHRAAARRLRARLEEGADVAFLTIGDPGLYSTFGYLCDPVRAAGFAVRIVPGVPSFCAAAAALGADLCRGREPLHILPGAAGSGLELDGTKVLMKSGRELPRTLELLGERGLLASSLLAERVGLSGERLCAGPDAEAAADGGYFTTIIVKG